MADAKDALSVPCPVPECMAAIGERCRNTERITEPPRLMPHAQRVELAAAMPEVERANPDVACPHPDFRVWATVVRLGDETGGTGPAEGFACELRVNCSACDEPFRWIGDYPVGLQPNRPTLDAKGYVMRAPIAPGSSDPDFGLGLGGFIVREGGPDG